MPMTYEEIYRLKVQPEGEDKLVSLTAAFLKQRTALDDMAAALQSAGVSNISANKAYAEQLKLVQSLNEQLIRSKVAYQTSQDAQQKAIAGLAEGSAAAAQKADSLAKAAGRVSESTSKSRMSGSGLLQIGYAIDDLQYGIRGVANNIPNLLMALGTGAGLAGGISVVVTVAAQLYERWGGLMQMFGMGATQTEADRMERLAKATEKTVAEAEKLEKYQRRQSAEKAQDGPTDASKKMESGVNDAVRNYGQEKAADVLSVLRRDRYINSDAELAKQARAVKAADAKLQADDTMRGEFGRGYGMSDAQRAKIQAGRDAAQAKVEAGLNAAAKADLAGSAIDPDKRRALQELIMQNPGAFGPNGAKLAGGLLDSSPEAVAGEKQDAIDAHRRDLAKKAADDAAKKAMEGTDADIASTDAADDANLATIKKNRAKNLQKAKDSGLGPLITEQLKLAIESGGNDGALREKLGKALSEKFGAAASREMLKDAGTDAKTAALADWIAGPQEQKRRNSTTIGGSDISKAIQAGVGGKDDTQMKILDKQARSLAVLEAMLKLQGDANARPAPPVPPQLTK